MSRDFDAVVVGVGAMGAAACWRLARRGARILGLERYELGHGLGSSGGRTRMIRLAYFEHPDYVPLLRRAYELWDALEGDSGVRCLHRTGAVYVGPRDGDLVAGSTRSAIEHGLPHETLDRAALARRHPRIEVPDGHAALVEPEGGLLLADRGIVAMAAEARRHGAEIREGEPALGWSADDAGVAVTTARGTVRAERLILAAGAWTGALAPDLGVELAVTRQAMAWVEPAEPGAFALGKWPCWAIEHDGGLAYGFPVLPGETTMKVAYHRRGPAADPETLDRTGAAADADAILPLLERYVPSGVGPVRRRHVCLYTWSDDGHFVLDRHPVHGRVVVACGFSGHGFKFAPVIGEALADLALDGATALPTGFLGAGRFGSRRPDAAADRGRNPAARSPAAPVPRRREP